MGTRHDMLQLNCSSPSQIKNHNPFRKPGAGSSLSKSMIFTPNSNSSSFDSLSSSMNINLLFNNNGNGNVNNDSDHIHGGVSGNYIWEPMRVKFKRNRHFNVSQVPRSCNVMKLTKSSITYATLLSQTGMKHGSEYRFQFELSKLHFARSGDKKPWIGIGLTSSQSSRYINNEYTWLASDKDSLGWFYGTQRWWNRTTFNKNYDPPPNSNDKSKYHHSTKYHYGLPGSKQRYWETGDMIEMIVDCINYTIRYKCNGKDLGFAFKHFNRLFGYSNSSAKNATFHLGISIKDSKNVVTLIHCSQLIKRERSLTMQPSLGTMQSAASNAPGAPGAIGGANINENGNNSRNDATKRKHQKTRSKLSLFDTVKAKFKGFNSNDNNGNNGGKNKNMVELKDSSNEEDSDVKRNGRAHSKSVAQTAPPIPKNARRMTLDPRSMNGNGNNIAIAVERLNGND